MCRRVKVGVKVVCNAARSSLGCPAGEEWNGGVVGRTAFCPSYLYSRGLVILKSHLIHRILTASLLPSPVP